MCTPWRDNVCAATPLGGISEFTELPLGYDRSCIRRNLLLTALGTKSKGEHTTFLRGFFLKGPEILLFRDSLAKFF